MPKGKRVAGETALTDHEKIFVERYLKDFNASAAAREAYPNLAPSTQKKEAHKILRRPAVEAAVDAAIERRRKRFEIDADRVLGEAAAIGFGDIRDVVKWNQDGVTLVDSDDLTREQAAMVAEVIDTVDKDGKRTTRVKMHPKMPALELLGKHLKLWNDTNVNLLVANLTALPDDALERRVIELIARSDGNGGAVYAVAENRAGAAIAPPADAGAVRTAAPSTDAGTGGEVEPATEDRTGPHPGGTESPPGAADDPELPGVSEAG